MRVAGALWLNESNKCYVILMTAHSTGWRWWRRQKKDGLHKFIILFSFAVAAFIVMAPRSLFTSWRRQTENSRQKRKIDLFYIWMTFRIFRFNCFHSIVVTLRTQPTPTADGSGETLLLMYCTHSRSNTVLKLSCYCFLDSSKWMGQMLLLLGIDILRRRQISGTLFAIHILLFA